MYKSRGERRPLQTACTIWWRAMAWMCWRQQLLLLEHASSASASPSIAPTIAGRHASAMRACCGGCGCCGGIGDLK